MKEIVPEINMQTRWTARGALNPQDSSSRPPSHGAGIPAKREAALIFLKTVERQFEGTFSEMRAVQAAIQKLGFSPLTSSKKRKAEVHEQEET